MARRGLIRVYAADAISWINGGTVCWLAGMFVVRDGLGLSGLGLDAAGVALVERLCARSGRVRHSGSGSGGGAPE